MSLAIEKSRQLIEGGRVAVPTAREQSVQATPAPDRLSLLLSNRHSVDCDQEPIQL
jgi:hypothetical protein